MRTEKEIQAMITHLEEVYPEGMAAGINPISNYSIGIIAGLKSALGEYPSFAEIDFEDFMKANFTPEILAPCPNCGAREYLSLGCGVCGWSYEMQIPKPKIHGGSFEDLNPELQEILSKRCPCDTASWLVEEARLTSEKETEK